MQQVPGKGHAWDSFGGKKVKVMGIIMIAAITGMIQLPYLRWLSAAVTVSLRIDLVLGLYEFGNQYRAADCSRRLIAQWPVTCLVGRKPNSLAHQLGAVGVMCRCVEERDWSIVGSEWWHCVQCWRIRRWDSAEPQQQQPVSIRQLTRCRRPPGGLWLVHCVLNKQVAANLFNTFRFTLERLHHS